MGRAGIGERREGREKGKGMTCMYLQPLSIYASVNEDLLVKGRRDPDWKENIQRGRGRGG